MRLFFSFTQCPPTFPLGTLVDLQWLAMLQVRMRQAIVGWRSTQKLLRTAAAVQAILAAVWGCGSFGRAPQTLNLPAEGTPSRAWSLTDGAARDHWVVLTRKWTERWVKELFSCDIMVSGVPTLTLYSYFSVWLNSAWLYCLCSCFFPLFFKST